MQVNRMLVSAVVVQGEAIALTPLNSEQGFMLDLDLPLMIQRLQPGSF
jgi:hypothetical protein